MRSAYPISPLRVCTSRPVFVLCSGQKGGSPMDQIKIGRFVAETRRAKGLTQRQLADQLSISDKTISKWETGVSLR